MKRPIILFLALACVMFFTADASAHGRVVGARSFGYGGRVITGGYGYNRPIVVGGGYGYGSSYCPAPVTFIQTQQYCPPPVTFIQAPQYCPPVVIQGGYGTGYGTGYSGYPAVGGFFRGY